MKVKYFAALAAASVVGMTALTGCGGDTTTEEVAPDATTMEEPAATDGTTMEEPADGAAMEEPADPCAAK
ncbi:MAG: hypothetical protein WA947_04460 [Phormidesmis sp.]